MPFDTSIAVELGHFVQDAYNIRGAAAPASFKLSDATYKLISVIYGDDQWDKVDGYVPFGFVAQSAAAPYAIVVSIRGTESIWDWMADAAFVRRACPVSGAPAGAETEDGFTTLFESLRVAPTQASAPLRTAVQTLLAGIGAANVGQVYVCGHSLGGALATLVAADLAGSRIVNSPVVYTLASPAVGEKTFASWCDGLVPDSYRICNAPDIVPTLPPPIFGYTHVEEAYQINSGAGTQCSLLCYHSLETYLHFLDPTVPLDPACAVQTAPSAPSAPAAS
ncbi:MAG TPA: lipase family protein [Opitutaceae bacterium]|nr:lipase family protein [Opitutaceae bacterium]